MHSFTRLLSIVWVVGISDISLVLSQELDSTSPVDSLWEAENEIENQGMMQIKLGDFEVELLPTPESLSDIDQVLGPAIEQVVEATFLQSSAHADIFQYMLVANVKYTAQRSTTGHRFRQRQRHMEGEMRTLNTATATTTSSSSSTIVVFNGGVVAFDLSATSTTTVGTSTGLSTVAAISSATATTSNSSPATRSAAVSEIQVASMIETSIEAHLRDTLVLNGGPWAFIEEVRFTNLEPPPTPAPTSQPVVLTESPISTESPTSSPTFVPTMSPTISTISPTSLSNPIDPTPIRSTPSPTHAPTQGQPSLSPTSIVGEPTRNINNAQEQTSGNMNSDNNNETRTLLLGGLFGVALVVVASLMFTRLSRRRTTHQDAIALAMSDAESDHGSRSGSGSGSSTLTAMMMIPGDKLNLHPQQNHHLTATKDQPKQQQQQQSHLFQDDQYSQMAQYAPGDILDNVSIASEWTTQSSEGNYGLSTERWSTTQTKRDSNNDDMNIRNSGTHQFKHKPSTAAATTIAAIGFASGETFERDRRVTLQKDMLQSEWTTAMTPTSNTIISTTTGSNGPMSANSQDDLRRKNQNQSQDHTTSSTSAIQSRNATTRNSRLPPTEFQQAFPSEEGEEVYLMPSNTASTSSSSRSSSGKHHHKYAELV